MNFAPNFRLFFKIPYRNLSRVHSLYIVGMTFNYSKSHNSLDDWVPRCRAALHISFIFLHIFFICFSICDRKKEERGMNFKRGASQISYLPKGWSSKFFQVPRWPRLSEFPTPIFMCEHDAHLASADLGPYFFIFPSRFHHISSKFGRKREGGGQVSWECLANFIFTPGL